MRILPPNPELVSLNTATVREKWNLRQAIEGCARHGVRGISPWRDKLAELGVKEAAKLIRDNGLKVTGLCRGGMFPAAERKGRQAAIDDNLRAIDDAAANAEPFLQRARLSSTAALLAQRVAEGVPGVDEADIETCLRTDVFELIQYKPTTEQVREVPLLFVPARLARLALLGGAHPRRIVPEVDGRVIADEISDRYGPDVLVDYLINFMENSQNDGPFTSGRVDLVADAAEQLSGAERVRSRLAQGVLRRRT